MSDPVSLLQRVAVSLNWTPPSDRLEIVRGIENAGFPGSVLMGGALRDPYLGLPDFKDYDLWARSPVVIDSDSSESRNLQTTLRERISQIPGAGDITNIEIELGEYPNAKVHFTFRGKPAELMLGNEEPSAAGMALRRNSTPICAVAMDSSGQVVAHPLFEEHAKGKIFEPESSPTPNDVERFAKLAMKISGLSFPNDPNQEIGRIVNAANRMVEEFGQPAITEPNSNYPSDVPNMRRSTQSDLIKTR